MDETDNLESTSGAVEIPVETAAEAPVEAAVDVSIKAPDAVTHASGGRVFSAAAQSAAHTGESLGLIQKIGLTVAIVAGQALLIWLMWLFFRKISAKISADNGNKIKPLTIKKFKLLTSAQIIEIILVLLKIAKYLVTAFQLFITVPIVFSLYPQTVGLASTIFGYVLNPLTKIVMGVISYIPNMITIIIIVFIIKYVLKGIKFFTDQIEKGKLKIPGFYTDWARPTYNILKVLLYAFSVAVIYPYLPGSESRIFQGVSVFVGVIFSLGSSTAIGNLIAGLVITYMRPFIIGDRIRIKDISGFVVEKSPFVIRMKNAKNEYITFPNLTVLNSEVTNYNGSAQDEALLLHTKITMGYDIPWRKIYDILTDAATKTPKIEQHPSPFVLQTALDDFYATYEINAYTRDVEHFQRTYSLLYQNIQDGFANAGISMFNPHYISTTVPAVRKDGV